MTTPAHEFTLSVSAPHTVVVSPTWVSFGMVHAWGASPEQALTALH